MSDETIGLSTKSTESVIKHTIEDVTKAIYTSIAVNAGVVIFGAMLIITSFVVGAISGKWELALGFGGFGIAGIVATLVTSPLTTIGKSARQIVQVQMAYLAFMSQVNIISDSNAENKSEILGNELDRIMNTLKTSFE